MTTAIPRPTVREAYDQVLEYFSRPDAVLSKTVDGTCHYRGPEDSRCAFGILIPDEAYDPKMENRVADVVICKYAAFRNWRDEAGGFDIARFVARAQSAHDNSRSVPEFLDRLRELEPTA